MLVCFLVPQPLLHRHNPSNKNDYLLVFVLVDTMFYGCITDSIGVHSLVDAFIVGLLVPLGPLSQIVLHKMEGFMSKIMLPVYFTSTV